MIDLSEFEVDAEVVDEDREKLEAWLEQRHGCFTSSNFGKLMTRSKTKGEDFGITAMQYIFEVSAEVVGSYKPSFESRPTDWGHDNEGLAVQAYERYAGEVVDYDSHRFVSMNEYVGGSPDGLVGSKGVIEIKCPYDPSNHIKWMIADEIPKEHKWQVAGHCLVTGRDWCDFVSFDPRIEGPLRLFVKRYERDALVDELKDRLELAVLRLGAVLRTLAGKVK